jgi:hypothetical protein
VIELESGGRVVGVEAEVGAGLGELDVRRREGRDCRFWRNGIEEIPTETVDVEEVEVSFG